RFLVTVATPVHNSGEPGEVDRALQASDVMLIAVVIEPEADVNGEAGRDLEVVVDIRAETVGARVGERNAFRSLRGAGTAEKETGKRITAGLIGEAQEAFFEIGRATLDVDTIKLRAHLDVVLAFDDGEVAGWLVLHHVVESVTCRQLLQCEGETGKLRNPV